jgi:uncharacterized membrane protein
MNGDERYEARSGERLAVGLGWFSVALGLAELAAPRSVARLIGLVPDEATVSILRSYGARELGNGFAILAQPDNATWVWSRVAGDALDMATLAGALSSPTTQKGRATLASAAVLGVTALDVICAQQLTRHGERSDVTRLASSTASEPGMLRVTHVVTINQPIERVEERWANLETLPPSLRNLGSPALGEDTRSFVQFRPAPGARGTEVRIELEYPSRGGAVGQAIARIFGQDPGSKLKDDLHRFKQFMETGEIPLSEGPALWRPAQPAADPQQLRNLAGV